MDAFMGTIMAWPIDFAPRGWALCDGTLMQINANSALFSLLGTRYGGDGQATFALPDLRGRTVLGVNGQAPLTNRALGAKDGAEKTTVAGNATGALTLTEANLPAHSHSATLSMSGLTAATEISVSTGNGGQLTATAGATLASTASGASGAAIYQPSTVPAVAPVTLGGVKTTVSGSGSVAIGSTGGGTPVPVSVPINIPVSTLPPVLALNYIICVEGIYPSRP